MALKKKKKKEEKIKQAAVLLQGCQVSYFNLSDKPSVFWQIWCEAIAFILKKKKAVKRE